MRGVQIACGRGLAPAGCEALRELSHWLAPPGPPKWELLKEVERKDPVLDAGVAGGVAEGVANGVPGQATACNPDQHVRFPSRLRRRCR